MTTTQAPVDLPGDATSRATPGNDAEGVPSTGRAAVRLALVGIALLTALAVAELLLDRVERGRVPSRADWEAAARAVRHEHRPGALVLTAPTWADPLGRLVLGDLLTLDDITRPDAATYSTLFELSLRGARHPDTRGARVVWRRRFGQLTATRYARTPARVTTDFYQGIAKAEVWEERRGHRGAPCRFDRRKARFHCGPRWKSVRAIRAEVGFAPRRCVLAHPIDGAARVIEFRDVDPGTRLVIYTGYAGYDPRYRARRAVWEYGQWRAGRLSRKRPLAPVAAVPVTLAVALDGRAVGRVRHPIDDESWRRTVLGVPATAPGVTAPASGSRRATVRFTVTTRHAWSKNFCFYARAEGGTP